MILQIRESRAVGVQGLDLTSTAETQLDCLPHLRQLSTLENLVSSRTGREDCEMEPELVVEPLRVEIVSTGR